MQFVGAQERSQIKVIGYYEKEDCGYCHQAGGTSSYGFISSKILSPDYHSLMLRGFRRSGNFFYKPTMHKVR
jgi:arginyl-tRNA--protein-N-Asp/Glu arginylyltransferase